VSTEVVEDRTYQEDANSAVYGLVKKPILDVIDYKV
jgi:hypothetical protein